MSTVTAAQIKKLRQATGASLLDCKKALIESTGDEQAARDWLRARGAAIASKKAGRTTSEGIIAFASSGQQGVLVEVLAETDFVASNDQFKAFASQVALAALQAGKTDANLATLPDPAGAGTIEDLRLDATLKIGENIQLGQHHFLACQHKLSHYIHHNGKIGVVADIATAEGSTVGKDICMHIAALQPSVIAPENYDAAELSRLRTAWHAELATSSKPAEIHEKIVTGKVNKFLAECSLLKQQFIKDDSLTVADYLHRNNAQVLAYELLVIA